MPYDRTVHENAKIFDSITCLPAVLNPLIYHPGKEYIHYATTDCQKAVQLSKLALFARK